jgi:hypothetical protein
MDRTSWKKAPMAIIVPIKNMAMCVAVFTNAGVIKRETGMVTMWRKAAEDRSSEKLVSQR